MEVIQVFDAKGKWHQAIIDAADRAGLKAVKIDEPKPGDGYGFFRPSPNPSKLAAHQNVYRAMTRSLKMVQDSDQVDVYEDKSSQFTLYADWMPETWRFDKKEAAMLFVTSADYPLVGKSNEGASSRNVRVLKKVDDGIKEVNAAFGSGITVDHGQAGKTLQKGYVLLQKFIPHKITYRVNSIGGARAIFFRYCYPDKPLAQTGNVEPCDRLDDEMESLLEWSDRFFKAAKTNWCALDVLKDGDKWKLLETSLAWPWPSPGRCNEGPIFRSNHRWIGMFDVLMDEIKGGTFG